MHYLLIYHFGFPECLKYGCEVKKFNNLIVVVVSAIFNKNLKYFADFLKVDSVLISFCIQNMLLQFLK